MHVSVRGLRVHVVEEGRGRPIVLLHGMPVDHRFMRYHLEPLLAERPGWRRLYVDMPGMGRTPGADWIAGHSDMRDVIVETIDALVGAEERFSLAGYSYGGYLAMGVAQERGSRLDGRVSHSPQGLGGRAVRPDGRS